MGRVSPLLPSAIKCHLISFWCIVSSINLANKIEIKIAKPVGNKNKRGRLLIEVLQIALHEGDNFKRVPTDHFESTAFLWNVSNKEKRI